MSTCTRFAVGGTDRGRTTRRLLVARGPGAVLHDPISAQVWTRYLAFLTQHELGLPLLWRVGGAFVALPLAVAGLLSRFSFKQQIETHVRGLRYEPDLNNSVALAARPCGPLAIRLPAPAG